MNWNSDSDCHLTLDDTTRSRNVPVVQLPFTVEHATVQRTDVFFTGNTKSGNHKKRHKTNKLIVKSVYEQLVNFPKKRTKQIRKRLDTNDERRLWASPAESWQSPSCTWSSLTLSKVDAIRAARSSEDVDNIQTDSIPSSPGLRQLTRDHHIDMAEIFSSG